MFKSILSALMGALLILSPLGAEAKAPWKVKSEWILAHENFLAGDTLRGRQSASNDEAIAAAYVAAQFQSFGLKPAPSLSGYVQTAEVVMPKPDGAAKLRLGDRSLEQGKDFYLVYSNVASIEGAVAFVKDSDEDQLPEASIWIIDKASQQSLSQWARLAMPKGVKLVIVAQTEALTALVTAPDFETRVAVRLAEVKSARARPDMIVLKSEVFDTLKASEISHAQLTVTDLAKANAITSNAIGYIEGTDPTAGTILISAHLDHLGVKVTGEKSVIFHGANDDASGTVAVIELARAMAAGPRPKRNLLFVCYGSEEAGLLGSQYFAAHPPVPLDQIVANLEIEMIGQQDPKLPQGVMMMTGFDRSDFGPTMQAKGAKIATDPYSDQHFFERSDNYALALKGIVAHTVSGWAVTPTYHTPYDDIAHLNIDYMAGAITSLVEPLRYLANSDYTPKWREGGKPK